MSPTKFRSSGSCGDESQQDRFDDLDGQAGFSQVTGAFAEFERSMIRQRVKAGLKRAVAQGIKLGRPKIDSTIERRVRRQLAKGVGILKVAKSLGIGTGTVQRISNELR